MKTKPFEGVVTEASDLPVTMGGKTFLVEVTLADRTPAYILASEAYRELHNDIRAALPGDHEFWDINIQDSPVHGEYVEWKGMKVIVSIRLGGR